MYERFTDRSRKVLLHAEEEAKSLNHEYIGTEHLLLGLIKEGSGVGANVLRNLDCNLDDVRQKIKEIIQPGPDKIVVSKLPHTPRTLKIIEHAIDEASKLNHNYIGTEHLLLGLLRETEGSAAQVLMNFGIDLKTIRMEVLNLLGWPKDKFNIQAFLEMLSHKAGKDFVAFAVSHKLVDNNVDFHSLQTIETSASVCHSEDWMAVIKDFFKSQGVIGEEMLGD